MTNNNYLKFILIALVLFLSGCYVDRNGPSQHPSVPVSDPQGATVCTIHF